jgi:hypothetical protein
LTGYIFFPYDLDRQIRTHDVLRKFAQVALLSFAMKHKHPLASHFLLKLVSLDPSTLAVKIFEKVNDVHIALEKDSNLTKWISDLRNKDKVVLAMESADSPMQKAWIEVLGTGHTQQHPYFAGLMKVYETEKESGFEPKIVLEKLLLKLEEYENDVLYNSYVDQYRDRLKGNLVELNRDYSIHELYNLVMNL